LPAVIVRPTTIAADSQTGECERTTPLYQLVDAVLSVPPTQIVRIPQDRAPLHLVAVDYVARAAYYAGRRRDTVGSTLHLADAHPTTVGHLLELVLDACGHERREKSSIASRLPQPVSDLSRACAALRGPHVFYDTRQLDGLLSQSGIACPPFREYADKLVHFVQGRRKRHA
jgi:nucleoside-diphosphate-sugar epimerase